MDDDITYAVEFGNKIYTYKHRSTVEFCTDIQVRKEFKNLKGKIVIIKIEVSDILREDHIIKDKVSFDEI